MSHEKSIDLRRRFGYIIGGGLMSLGTLGIFSACAASIELNGKRADCVSANTSAACHPGYTFEQGKLRVERFAIGSTAVVLSGISTLLIAHDVKPSDTDPGGGPGGEPLSVIDIATLRGRLETQLGGQLDEAA